jgi:tight adherence protein B
MTLALLAVAVAVLVWPATRRADLRLRRLVDAARLAGAAAPARRGRRLPAIPPQWAGLLAAVATSVAAFVWRGPAVAIAAGVAAAVIAASITRAAGRRDALARDRDLSAALRLLRGELDVGSRPEAALLAAASVAGAYRSAFEAGAVAVRDGADIVAAMSGSAMSRPAPELVVIAQAWALAGVTGAPLADVLGRVDDDVQARRAQVRAVASALAGPRSSAALLAALPVLGVVLGTAMGGRPLTILFDSDGGRWLLCAGVLLDVAGLLWTSRLVTAAERG